MSDLELLCFCMFLTLCLSIYSRLQAEAPEITQVKPMSCASSARALPLCCYGQSKNFQTFVMFGFLCSTVILYICNIHQTKEVFPILLGNSWSLLVFEWFCCWVFFIFVPKFYTVLQDGLFLSVRVTLDHINFQHNQPYGS